MFQRKIKIKNKKQISNDIFLINFYTPEIASNTEPGQFINIKVTDLFSPYLRRPFSICEVENESIGILFNIAGSGTRLLALSNQGDEFDCIGPLGKGFNYQDKFTKAVIVAGGLGAAPFPFLIQKFEKDIEIISYVGSRTADQLIDYKLQNVHYATDDGSKGFYGNVISLLKNDLKYFDENTKIFGCGPTLMLKELVRFSLENNLNCEISTECAMACGFGLCQGCNIESSDHSEYKLVCKDGPVFNARDIIL